MPDTHTIFCIIEGDNRIFPVKISSNEAVGSLKKAIKEEMPLTLSGIEAHSLTLYLVNVLEEELNVEDEMNKRPKALPVSSKLSQLFDPEPAAHTVHIIASLPPGRCLINHFT